MDAPGNKWYLVVKVKYGDTLRRFNVCVNGRDIDHDMNKLRTKIITLFKFNPNANLVLTYTDRDGDAVTLVDDDELHDAVFRQQLDPLRINVQLNTDFAARAEARPNFETSNALPKTGAQSTQAPQPSSAIDDALQSVPDPLRSVLSRISHDFMSKAAESAPALGEFVEYFSKLGQSHVSTFSNTAENADLGKASGSATNPLDHSTGNKTKPIVLRHPSSQNSSVAHQVPQDNMLQPGFGNMTEGMVPSVPDSLVHVTFSNTPENAELGRASGSATNPLDHSTGNKPKPIVLRHPSSQNSSVVNQVPQDNMLQPGFGNMTESMVPSVPDSLVHVSMRIPSPPSVKESVLSAWLAKDKVEGKKVANDQTDGKSIATTSVPAADQSVHHRSQNNFTSMPTSPVACPPGITDALCSDVKNISCSTPPSLSHLDFNAQKSLPVNKHNSEHTSNQIPPSVLPHILSAYRRSHGHYDSMLRTFHRGVRCDGCGMHPIMGPRFKSNVKEDFDLCSICFSEMGNEADYTRIDRAPYRSPRFLKEFNNPHSRFHGPQGCRGYGLRPHKGKLESRFIQDVTVLDGTLMAPSTPFTKIWRMRNNGTIVWPSGTQLVWIGGDQFAERGSVDLEISQSGFPVDEEIDIAVDFRAPSRPGRYVSYWRMASPSGQKFGQRVWVLIQVDNSRPNSASGIFHPELNLNLPPEASEQGGVGIIDVNVEPVDSIVLSEVDILDPNLDLVKPLVDEVCTQGNAAPPVLAAGCGGSTPPLSEMPSSSSSFPMIDFSSQPFPATAEGVVPPSGEASLGDASTGDNPVEHTLLKELEEMGFKQIDLNKEVLRLNDYDLEQSLNDLCGISEWDPILDELQEMGFCDKERNKKLLIKNGGSIKRVVLDLIAGEKAQ